MVMLVTGWYFPVVKWRHGLVVRGLRGAPEFWHHLIVAALFPFVPPIAESFEQDVSQYVAYGN